MQVLTPGQTEYIPFTLAETPDATPTVSGVYKSSGGVYELVAGTLPSVAVVSGLAYYAAYTVPDEAVTGERYSVLISVVTGGTERLAWLDGGMVDLGHGLTAGQAVQIDAIKAKTELIGTGTLRIISDGFTQDGLLRITRGDSYGVGHGKPTLTVVDTEDKWPDISTATTITLTVRSPQRVEGVEPAVQLTATTTDMTVQIGGHKSASFIVPSADTASMIPGAVEWDIQAEWVDGSVATIAGPEATGIVLRDQTTPAA